jgi:F-type H+-transporting ATPase subunit b
VVTVRKRVPLVLALLALVAFVAGAGAASAQVEPGTEAENEELAEEAIHAAEEAGATHEDAECIAVLVEGNTVDDCQESPSLIAPATNELIWGAISFVVLVFLLWKFAWPGIKNGMENRSERIRRDLSEAESARTQAEQVLAGYQSQLADARNESARIIEEARQTADSMRRDLQQRAEADVAEMRQKAAADIEAAKAQAVADLQAEVASLAIGAAEQVVERSLDRETNVALVERYIQQVSAGRS